MMDSPVRVLVLCCNRLLRESIARIIKKRTDFHVIASQSLGPFSVDELGELRADVLVCDSLLFIQEGRSPRLQATKAPIKSVLVAMDDNPENFLTAVRSGVLGYVLQEAAAAEVVSVIRAVAAGEAVCPSRLTKLLFDYIASQPVDLSADQTIEQPRLSRREQQLIPLINQGLTNKEIAYHLHVSEETIKSHVHRILRKVGVEDRQNLARLRPGRTLNSPTTLQS